MRLRAAGARVRDGHGLPIGGRRSERTAAGDAVDFRISLLQIDRELALAEVSEVIALYAWNNANPDGAVLAYGGGAVGPDGTFLGDASYSSIGVFAWDPGRISQIMIHEVLHNIDDMFSMSGMPDDFLNADEMSRNMPTLLAERPGAFLPQYDDDEMISYAERERANRATYPWAMQLVYYAWMLGRTPREAWLELDYGRPAPAKPVSGARPLYDHIFLGRANTEVYLPLVAGGALEPPEVRLGVGPAPPRRLERRTYHHTDFDGSTIFQGDYFSGWLKLLGGGERVAIRVGDTAPTEIVGLRMGDLTAQASSWP